MFIFWIFIFVVSLIVLIKGADWLIESAEKIGLAVGLSSFIVGVIIVGAGTSLPELFSSLAAVLQKVPEVVVANVVGSNIANILLIVGISAVIGRRLVVTKNLIDIDLPLLATVTVILLGILWDKQVNLGESLLMLISYIIYLLYSVFHKDSEDVKEMPEIFKIEQKKISELVVKGGEQKLRSKVLVRDLFFLILGILGLILGAKYLIESLVKISEMLNVIPGVIAITAVAVGTSLPELIVSAKAAFQKKSEIALGNIFGSNIFNSLIIVGLPGLFEILPVDHQTFNIGIPTMIIATILFIISGISRRIHLWEGAFYLAIYTLFIAKLFKWF